MRPHWSRCGVPASAALLLLSVAACGDAAPTEVLDAPVSPAPVAGDGPDARGDLAARAALAEDKAYAGLYTLDDGGGRQRNVVATIGADGTWKVDVGGGALGGSADVSIVSVEAGVYQCTLASANNPITPSCVRVADPGGRVPRAYDPKVERLFRQSLTVFTDRQSALSVTEVRPLAGAQGTCFSIDSISASLDAPVDVGIYCYTDDGVLSAARVGFGTITLVSLATGPASVPLPGPEAGGEPLRTASPPPPPVIEPSGASAPAA